MISTIAFSAFVAASCGWMGARALRDHRSAMEERHGLLDAVAEIFAQAHITFGRDHFPILTGRLEDGRSVKVELIGDTMVTRRLPQLWLRVTLKELEVRERPTVGALARPTGAEYYSLVHDMPEWMTPPDIEASLLMRGDGKASGWQVARVSALFRTLFADRAVKEAVITPRGSRIIRHAAQGEAGAHKVLRQARFAVTSIPPDLVRMAIAEAEALGAVLAVDNFAAPAYEAA